MAILNENQRREVHADAMRVLPGTVGITKVDLRAAVDAVDQWVSDNAAAFNAAIPQPARGSLTPAQKAFLLSKIAMKRYSEGT